MIKISSSAIVKKPFYVTKPADIFGQCHRSECLQKKIIGKPCTGKLYARFDEGKLEKCF